MPAVRRLIVLALLGTALGAVPASAAPAESQQVTWHGTQIKMYGAQAAGAYGRGVVVAVLDGWIDRSHPDFEGRALVGADCRLGSCTAGLKKQNCGSEHGTHVAGTIASSSYGVAPQATILPVQVLSSDSKGECTGSPSAVAAGIRYAVSHGARVINLSLGPDMPSGSASIIPSAVHDAATAGAVVVFSAGNSDLPVTQSYGSDALIVAATGPSGGLASYSQYGKGVSVAAPGGQPSAANTCTQDTCVTSLYPDDGYAVAAGTSMAAPHVSGLAALLWRQGRSRTRSAVITRIEHTASPLANAGFGLINVRAAMGVRGAPKPSPSPSPEPPVATPTRTKAPVVTPSPAAPTPVVTTPPPTPSAPPTLEPTPTDTPTAAPTTQASPTKKASDDIPVPLAGLAILLVVGAAAGVLTLGRR